MVRGAGLSLCSTPLLPYLSNAMASSLGLQVILWVPVVVKDDDRVGRRQVDAHTSSTRREHKDERVRCWVGEAVNACLAVAAADAAIDALMAVAAHVKVGLQEVQHLHHLAKDEHLLALLLQLGQQLVQQHHLA